MSRKERKWGFWVEEMLESIEKIRSYTKGMDKQAFMNDARTRDSVAMNIAVNGEGSTHIPDDILKKYPVIPWREIKDMRNIIAHEYPGIDWSLLWGVIENRLAELEETLQEMLEREVL
jgi:hypothetical protein